MTGLLKTRYYIHQREARGERNVRVVFTDLGPFRTATDAYRHMEYVETAADGSMHIHRKPEFVRCIVDKGDYLLRSPSTPVLEPFHKPNEGGKL